jgi:hypothetical protein
MIVRVQLCKRYPLQGLFFRALCCGGVLISTKDGNWTRKKARAMLDALGHQMPNVRRSNIRFKHV